MIIRVNFYNNDIAVKFENFFDRFKFVNYYANMCDLKYKDDEDSLKLYKDTKIDMEELFDKVFFKPDKLSQKEGERFARYVKESIIAYISKRIPDDMLEYIKDIDVTLIDTFSEKFENGEVIYYFINADKYIVQ